jgi:four helix bundle protein
MRPFDHERLEVYRVSLEFVAGAQRMISSITKGHVHLADQLHRASTSIVLNIAEGAGEFSRKEKARFYRMALRSATECAGVLDLFRCLELAPEDRITGGKEFLGRIVAMLTKMIQNLGGGNSGSGAERPQ